MRRIGLTGGIASGKSVVGNFLSAQGIPVCDADALTHTVMAPEGPAYADVLARFGEHMLSETRAIDRGKLGAHVFANAQERKDLEAIVHPHVRQACRDWMKQQHVLAAAVVMAPLLYEAGMESEVDAVICVAAPRTRRVQWLKQRGLAQADIQRRFDAQMQTKIQLERSDAVIYNSGSLAVLEEQARRAWDALAATPEKGCE